MNTQKFIFTAGFILSIVFLLIMLIVDITTEIPLEMLTNKAIFRIFHIHLASALTSYLMIAVSMIAGIILLKRKSDFISGLHFAGIEISFFFITFVLFSGMLWAKTSWGVYWNWEPRLTAAAVFWFLLFALLLLRSTITNESKDKISAIFTIIICCNIPFIHFASSLFGSRLHPASGTTEITGYAEVQIITWLTVCAVAVFSVFLLILRAKMHQQKT